jgi:hypothetical protein
MPDPSGDVPAVRLTEAERQHVIQLLSQHCADGRLTLYEMEDRMSMAARATTAAELVPLLADLPALPLRTTAAPRPYAGAHRAVRVHVTVYAAVMAFLVLVWLAAGGGYFWPIWPALGWGVILATHVGVTRALSSE